MSPAIAVVLIQLTDLGHHRVDMNVSEIVSLRDVTDGQLLADGAKCTVITVDGRFIAVVETCEQIRLLILEAN